MWDELDADLKGRMAEQQIERELAALDAGARRYWANWKRQDNVGRVEEDMLRPLFNMHAKRTLTMQKRMFSRRKGRVDPILRAFVGTAPGSELVGLSLLTPTTLMWQGGMTPRQDVAKVISAIGSAVRRTLVVATAKAEWEKRTENLQHVCADWTYDESRRWLKSVDLNPERWPQELSLKIGAALLREALLSNLLFSMRKAGASKRQYKAALIQCSTRNHNGMRKMYELWSDAIKAHGIFDVGVSYSGNKQQGYMELTERAFEALVNGHLGGQDLAPVLSPMIIPPADWTNDFDGGYTLLRNNLVKPVRHNAGVEAGANDGIRDAVNCAQRTTWMVDGRVVGVMREVWDRGGDRCGLPNRERSEMPPKAGPGASAEDIKAAKLARKLAWDEWYNEQSTRLSVAKTINEGRELIGQPFWYVWNLDFRGRMYPMADCLSPQGADYQKAPLIFAKAVTLTTNDAVNWLMVNLANLYGVDKVSLAERVRWVETNEYKISQTIMDPMRTIDWWGEADKPWCFLAACYDYMDFRRTGASRIPVAMDGSCNGIQHLSALGRDKRGAIATNLLACPEPNDIYGEVAEELYPLIAASDSEYRQLFPPERVTRKLCKRATMTTPYGVTRQGIKSQFISDGHLKHLPKELQVDISQWLTGLTTEAIGEVVKSAREVMDWLQDLAKRCNEQGKAMQWTTPDGKVVTQEYLKTTTYTVRVPGMGKVLFHLARTELGINKNNQRNGAAPNFVHSLDACHAKLCIRDMQFVTVDTAYVHDSFACHAEYAPFHAYVIRNNFVWMHKQPLLERLHEEISQQLDGAGFAPPSPPIVGDLNVSLVSGAEYFFA